MSSRAMVFCRGCGKEIHESAPACPHCGSIQQAVAGLSSVQKKEGPIWVPIVSLVLGIVSVLALFDDSSWDEETILGLGVFAVTGLVLGCISLYNKQRAGKGMAIAGVVMSSIGLLALIGLLVD